MLSLLDYLHYPAGSELGEEVYQFARSKKAKVASRQVKTAKYEGKVMLYEKELLDEFFKKGNDSLPF